MNTESVTLLIQQKVKTDSLKRYEQWLPRMMARAAQQEGHQGVHVIRPPAGGTDFSIMIRYATLADAEKRGVSGFSDYTRVRSCRFGLAI